MTKIIDAALYLTRRYGLYGFSRSQLARQSGVPEWAVPDLAYVRSRVVKLAHSRREWAVLGRALQEGDATAQALPASDRARALEALR